MIEVGRILRVVGDRHSGKGSAEMVDLSGAALLNLGCGYKTCDAENVANVDFGIFQQIAVSPVLSRVAPIVVGQGRAAKLRAIAESNLVVYDISKGIPASDSSVDAVYHSHMLEHLDRDVAVKFMSEVHRVLRPGGLHRICVPDFEYYVRRYLADLDNGTTPGDHDRYVADLIEQSVRREAAGSSAQSKLRRTLENLLLGDARKRGETHQWMYDRKNLSHLLASTGFADIRSCTFGESSIPNWSTFKLELDESGHEYKPGSLYMEARAEKR